MEDVGQSIIEGIGLALAMMFWIWFFRRLYLNGWRPLIFVLITVGWQRLKFYAAWIMFSRRRDKVDAFLDEAEAAGADERVAIARKLRPDVPIVVSKCEPPKT